MLSLSSKINFINEGKNIIKTNPFYYVLHLIIKSHFLPQKEIDFYNFAQNLLNSETDFKVFCVFKEFAVFIYNEKVKYLIKEEDNIDDIIFLIIYFVKSEYDKDRNIIKPYISNITENENIVLEKFNFIKRHYEINCIINNHYEKYEYALSLLEESKKLEKKSSELSTEAIKILLNIKNQFINIKENKFLSFT
jgi:hypothetical protein